MRAVCGALLSVLWMGILTACQCVPLGVRSEAVSIPAEERVTASADILSPMAARQEAGKFARELQVKLQNRPITLSLLLLEGEVQTCRVQSVGGSTDDASLIGSQDAETLCRLVSQWQFDASSPKEISLQFGAGHLQ